MDFNSIIKYGSNIGGSIVSPFGKDFVDFKSLMELAKLFYAYDIANLNTASLSLIDLFIDNKPFILNQAYDIGFKHIVEQLSGYLKEITINYSVDMIPSVNLSFIYIDRIFRKDIDDKIKIVRLKFMRDISEIMAIKSEKQEKTELLNVHNQKVTEIKESFIKSLGLLLIKSNLWHEFKEQFNRLNNLPSNKKGEVMLIDNEEERVIKFDVGTKIRNLFNRIKKQSESLQLEALSKVIYKDYLSN
jgi:hypothetical protein